MPQQSDHAPHSSRLSALRVAKRRLRIGVLLFCGSVTAAFGLLIAHILQELRRETQRQYEASAAELSMRINERIEKLFRAEERRPFDDYSFISLRTLAEDSAQTPEYSPLAKIPPETVIPGIIGFFQVYPDGAFGSPILPDVDPSTINNFAKLIPAKEAQLRLELKEELWQMLKDALARREDMERELELRLTMQFLAEDRLLFTRRVWRSEQRFLQGFVVDREPFFFNILVPELAKSPLTDLAEVRLAVADRELLYFRPGADRGAAAATREAPRIALYQGKLAAPLDAVTLQVLMLSLPPGKGAKGVYILLGVLAAVLVVGVSGLYYTAAHNIELAQQQNNFMSAVSHELKTPLASIRMYAEMLKSGWVGEETKRISYYETILQESERLSRLIQNVLYLAKLSRAQVELHRKELRVDEILSRSADTLRPHLERNGFVLEVSMPVKEEQRAALVSVDADAIIQIFVNLAENAVKFSKDAENKTVAIGAQVELAEGRERLTFFVRDFGPGVREKEKRKIFSLFYRGEDELTRRTPGTGIGLAIVAELAQSMGAAVQVHNAAPGARFEVVFR